MSKWVSELSLSRFKSSSTTQYFCSIDSIVLIVLIDWLID